MPRLFYDQTIKNCDNFDNDADDDEENDGFESCKLIVWVSPDLQITDSIQIATSSSDAVYTDVFNIQMYTTVFRSQPVAQMRCKLYYTDVYSS